MVRNSQGARRWKSSPTGVDCPLCTDHVYGHLKVPAKLLHINNFHADVEDLTAFNLFVGTDCQRCEACSKICVNSGRHQRASAADTACYQLWASRHPQITSQQSTATDDSDEDPEFSQASQVAVGIPPAPPTLAPPTINDAPARQTRSQARSQAPEPPAEPAPVAPTAADHPGPPPGLAAPPAAAAPTVHSIDELLALISFYGKHALYVTHWAWKDRLARVSKRLMDAIMPTDDPAHSARSQFASAALLLLPGVIGAMAKHKLGKPTDLLTTMDESHRLPARYLILEAQNLQKRIQQQQQLNAEKWESARTGKLSMINRQKLRIERLVMEGRLSAATVQTMALDNVVQTVQLDHAQGAPATTPRQLSREDACALLRRYNPEGNPDRDDIPDGEATDQAPLQVELRTVEEAVHSVNSQSASGYSAWTFALIRTMAGTRLVGADSSWLSSLTRLLNLMLANRLERAWWTPSRAVLLPKGDSAWRPLGIGDAFYRILGRAVMLSIGVRIGRSLRPIQLGAGTSGGSEIAGRLAQVMLNAHEDNVLLNLDLANAFNTIPRRLMWQGIVRDAPELSRWFRWAYGAPTDLRLSDGHVACLSETGSRQGDPLASLIFCLGFQFILEKVSWEIRRVCGNLPLPANADEPLRDQIARDDAHMRAATRALRTAYQPSIESTEEENAVGRAHHETLRQYAEARLAHPDRAGLVAYMDDVNLFMPADMLPHMCAFIQDAFDAGGMKLNVDKCQVLFATPTQQSHVGPFPVQRSGTLSMGVPTGPTEHRVNHTRTLLEAMRIPARCFSYLSAAAGFGILRYCVNARAGYLARVTETPEVRHLLAEFDQYVDDCLEVLLSRRGDAPEQRRQDEVAAAMLRAHGRDEVTITTAAVEEPPTPPDPPDLTDPVRRDRWLYGSALPRIRGLPTHLSGLGIPRYAGVAGEMACIRSRTMTSEFIACHHTLTSLSRGTRAWPEIQLGTHETMRDWVSPWQDAPDDPEAQPQPQRQEDVSIGNQATTIFQNVHQQLQQELSQHHMEAERAFFLSAAYTWSGKWLHAASFYGRYHGAYRFTSGEFLEALRLRCLFNPLAGELQRGGCPLCLCGADISREFTHSLDCTEYCGTYLTRRHNLCRDAFVNVVRDVDDYNPTIEVEAMVGLNPERTRRADVILHEPDAAMPVVFDFAVADPAARRYREGPEPSHTNAGAAGRFRAEEKRALYRQVGIRVTPAVLEATGRPHHDIAKWLQELGAKYKTDALRRFLSLSGIVVQRQNARAVMFLRSFRPGRISGQHRR